MALKVYSLDRVPANLVHTLVREVRIHAELSHRAVLTLYGVFQEASRLVLVLERAARGDLYQVHRRMLGSRMSEAQLAGVVLAPLLDALVYLHARGVCHRDIKVRLAVACRELCAVGCSVLLRRLAAAECGLHTVALSSEPRKRHIAPPRGLRQ